LTLPREGYFTLRNSRIMPSPLVST
jgi:hypothetical protein